MFYHEEMTFLGCWSPRITPERPEAGQRKMRAICEVNPSLSHLTLSQLRELYSPDGLFHHTINPTASAGAQR